MLNSNFAKKRLFPQRIVLWIFIAIFILTGILLLIHFLDAEKKPRYLDDLRKKELLELMYSGYELGPLPENFPYDVNSSWTSIVSNHPYYAYDVPHLSWKITGALNGLFYAYKASGDEQFFYELLQLLDACMLRRDNYEKRPAWDGNIYPIWGSTSRYYPAKLTLLSTEGKKLGTIRFQGSRHDTTLVSLTNLPSGKFNLSIKNEKIGIEYHIENATLYTIEDRINNEIDWSYYGSTLENQRIVSIDIEDYSASPAPFDYIMVESINIPSVCDNGLILKPMVQVMIELDAMGDPKAEEYRKTIRETIDALIELSWDERGFFKDPDDSQSYLGGGTIIPWNMAFSFVAPLAMFAEYENDARYSGIVKDFSNYFLEHVEKSDSGYLWKYWEDPTGTVAWYESTAYGGIDVMEIWTIYESGIAFSEDDIAGIVQTINNNIFVDLGDVRSTIDGSTKSAVHTEMLFYYLPYLQKAPKLFLFVNETEMNWQEAASLLYWDNKAVETQ